MRRNTLIAVGAFLATVGLCDPANAGPTGDEAPRAGLGAALFTWDPESATGANALVLGHVRVFVAGPLALQASVGYWRNQATGTTVEGWTTERSARDVPAAADLLLFARATPGFALRVGGGFVRHDWRLSRVTFTPTGTVRSTASESDVGGEIVVGVELRVAPGLAVTGEGRWQIGSIPDFPDEGEHWDYSGPLAGIGLDLYLW